MLKNKYDILKLNCTFIFHLFHSDSFIYFILMTLFHFIIIYLISDTDTDKNSLFSDYFS